VRSLSVRRHSLTTSRSTRTIGTTELSQRTSSVKCREVADQNRFVNNPSEIVVNVVRSWFRITQITNRKGNVTIRLHRSCAKDAAKTVFARSRIGLAWRTWRSNGFGHRAVVGRLHVAPAPRDGVLARGRSGFRVSQRPVRRALPATSAHRP